MSTLFEYDRQLEKICMLPDGNGVDTETGEFFTADALDALNMERSEKIEGCLLFIKDQRAKAEAIKKEINNLKERMEQHEKRASRISAYVQNSLQGDKFETAKVAVNYRKTTRCEVHVDAKELPEEFRNVVTTITPLKKELTAYLKAGNKVNGVELITEDKMNVL